MANDPTFDAFVTISKAVRALLHPQRYECKFAFVDSLGVFCIGVADTLAKPRGLANKTISADDLSSLECAGHVERFGADVAHELKRQLDEHAKASGMPMPRRNTGADKARSKGLYQSVRSELREIAGVD